MKARPAARLGNGRMRSGQGHLPLKAIVLAGGSGTRLEPYVRRLTGTATPKQFCCFWGRETLLQATVRRLESLVPERDVTVVVRDAHAPLAVEQLAGHAVHVLAQPGDRGTAPGILLPLTRIVRTFPEALVLIAPSDHGIGDEDSFLASVADARRIVEGGGADILLLGVAPDSACAEYGWIRPRTRARRLSRVAEFVEKPPPERAAELLRSGALWNTMICLARGCALLRLWASKRQWDVARFRSVWALKDGAFHDGLRRLYASIDPTDFSRDIVQSGGTFFVYRLCPSTNWTDLGTPGRLTAWLERHLPAAAPGSTACMRPEAAADQDGAARA